MLSAVDETTSFRTDARVSPPLRVLCGCTDILRLQPILMALSERCGQAGAMDHLEYFLTAPQNLKKIPYLVLLMSNPDVSVAGLRVEDLVGAVLVYEYKVLGFNSRLFTTCDFDGRRAVIAPAKLRVQVSATVCRYLMEQGAQVVLLNIGLGPEESCKTCFEAAMAGKRKRWWATQTREAGGTLPLQKTLNATLAGIGKHTRRNLRYYRRKAEAELDYVFIDDVKDIVTMAQMIELNFASTHPLSMEVLERRLAMMRATRGFFAVGLRQAGGAWLSLLGGRRHHGVTEVDWQMNRDGLEKFSMGTVIRSYLIENEIAIGMESLFFEGGTPHTMRHSFLPEEAMDIVVADRSLFVFLLRNGARWGRPRKNFLLQTLTIPEMKWQLR
jgi:hypothetical protein